MENIGFQFELGEADDDTHDILWEWNQKHPECWIFDPQVNHREPHKQHKEGQRAWKRDEYLRMVGFRNSLLERAVSRRTKFDYYFSLDSDVILENPKTIETLISHKKDVVAPLMFMTPTDEKFPNAMDWATAGNRWVGRRIKNLGPGLIKVDIPMAAIMMSMDVVKNVRYVWNAQGEDIGFASELHKKGFESFLDTNIYTPHIMHRYQLEDYLANGDRRSKNFNSQ